MKNNSVTHKTLGGLLSYSPGFILFSMILLFALKMIVDGFHYTDLFAPRMPAMGFAYAIGIGLAMASGLTRFALGLSGAYEFAKEKIWVGIFGLLFSLGMTIWQSFEASAMVAVWSKGESPEFTNIANGVLQFVVWAGWILEIRLAFHLAGSLTEPEKEQPEEPTKAGEAPTPSSSLPKPSPNGQPKPEAVNPQ